MERIDLVVTPDSMKDKTLRVSVDGGGPVALSRPEFQKVYMMAKTSAGKPEVTFSTLGFKSKASADKAVQNLIFSWKTGVFDRVWSPVDREIYVPVFSPGSEEQGKGMRHGSPYYPKLITGYSGSQFPSSDGGISEFHTVDRQNDMEDEFYTDPQKFKADFVNGSLPPRRGDSLVRSQIEAVYKAGQVVSGKGVGRYLSDDDLRALRDESLKSFQPMDEPGKKTLTRREREELIADADGALDPYAGMMMRNRVYFDEDTGRTVLDLNRSSKRAPTTHWHKHANEGYTSTAEALMKAKAKQDADYDVIDENTANRMLASRGVRSFKELLAKALEEVKRRQPGGKDVLRRDLAGSQHVVNLSDRQRRTGLKSFIKNLYDEKSRGLRRAKGGSEGAEWDSVYRYLDSLGISRGDLFRGTPTSLWDELSNANIEGGMPGPDRAARIIANYLYRYRPDLAEKAEEELTPEEKASEAASQERADSLALQELLEDEGREYIFRTDEKTGRVSPVLNEDGTQLWVKAKKHAPAPEQVSRYTTHSLPDMPEAEGEALPEGAARAEVLSSASRNAGDTDVIPDVYGGTPFSSRTAARQAEAEYNRLNASGRAFEDYRRLTGLTPDKTESRKVVTVKKSKDGTVSTVTHERSMPVDFSGKPLAESLYSGKDSSGGKKYVVVVHKGGAALRKAAAGGLGTDTGSVRRAIAEAKASDKKAERKAERKAAQARSRADYSAEEEERLFGGLGGQPGASAPSPAPSPAPAVSYGQAAAPVIVERRDDRYDPDVIAEANGHKAQAPVQRSAGEVMRLPGRGRPKKDSGISNIARTLAKLSGLASGDTDDETEF